MATMGKTKPVSPSTVTMRDAAFDLIRDLPILETQATHFVSVLERDASQRTFFFVACIIPPWA
jgi:hypothetical protein